MSWERLDRSIEQADYLRAYSFVMALRAYHHDDQHTPDDLVETLTLTYEDYVGEVPYIAEILDDPIPERVVAREFSHACVLLEAMLRGSDRMPEKVSVSLSPCAVPGCPELTYGAFCWIHELEKRKGS